MTYFYRQHGQVDFELVTPAGVEGEPHLWASEVRRYLQETSL